jgi:carboxylesterase
MKGEATAFEFPGDDRGVLCIHGFTGTPFEMRHLGERLAERGLTVSGPVLPGHVTSPADLDATTWRDWVEGVETAFDDLRSRCAEVAVVGQSLGGLLALNLARERGADMVAVASLAAPLWLHPVAKAAVWATTTGSPLRSLVRELPKLSGSDVLDATAKAQNPSYTVIPVRALHQLVDFMDVVADNLHRVDVPALVMHARQDHTAPYACAEHIMAHLGSSEVRFVSLDRSYHLIAIDVERDIVAAGVGEFFEPRFAS